MLLGILGTKPRVLIRYFRKQGYKVVVTTNRSRMDELAKEADACIMYYKFPATYGCIDAYGAHFVHYYQTPNGYIANNTYNNPYEFPHDLADRGDNFYAKGIFIFAQ